ncbi:MAG TPA: SDR family oxidoreductase [Rhizomicrobium sp.]|nr:SDR family oxidoreductase [Rhizomicrobium sp.]
MGRLDGKVAFVTGAGSGVGREVSKLFAREGAKIMLVGRTVATLEETKGLIEDAGGCAKVSSADISVDGAAEDVVAVTAGLFGRLDVLVHAAAVGFSWAEKSPGSMNGIAETSAEKWREIIRINLDGCYQVNRAAIIQMRNNGGGAIVNVASILGFQGLEAAHTYTAAKAGVINLTRSIAVTYARDGIRANVVAPGAIDTPMLGAQRSYFDDPRKAYRAIPLGRAASALEIAYGCLYLASEEASYCTGTVLTIDGGSTAK